MSRVHPQQPGSMVESSMMKRSHTRKVTTLLNIEAVDDGSIIELDEQKKEAQIDYHKMVAAVHDSHAKKPITGQPYKGKEACCKINVGSHGICFSSSKKSAIDHFGVGLVLYFKFLKRLMCYFFIFTLLSVAPLYLYFATYQNNNNNNDQMSYNEILSASTLGSIGLGSKTCALAQHPYQSPVVQKQTIKLECTSGTLTAITNSVYGLIEGEQTCNLINSVDINGDCIADDLEDLNEVFEDDCYGKTSCEIIMEESYFKQGDSECDDMYMSMNIYFEAKCNMETLQLTADRTITKEQIAYIVVFVDVLIVLIYLFMVYSLYYCQIEGVKGVLKNSYSAANYTVLIENLPAGMSAEELQTKLWKFIDTQVNPNRFLHHRVVDVQLVLPSQSINIQAKIGDTVKRKNILIRKFMDQHCPNYKRDTITLNGLRDEFAALMGSNYGRKHKAQKQFHEIKALAEKKVKLQQKLTKLVTERKTQILGAFITFNSIDAQARCVELFNASPLARCCMTVCECCVKKPVLFEKKVLRATPADDPGNILWDNLGESFCSLFIKRGLSIVITVGLWCVTGAVVGISTLYKNDFEKTYPQIDCGGKEPTKQEAADDFSLGSLQEGLMECYCTNDFSGRLNEEFETVDDRKLCLEWLQERSIYLAITFAIVFAVIIANFLVQGVFRLLSQFEKHTTLTKQLSSRVLKTFVAQFLNTAVIILFVNSKLEGISFWQGQYDDQVPLWYQNVGAVLLSTMVINVFTLPLVQIMMLMGKKLLRCCDRNCTMDPTKTRKKFQRDYESLYMNPEFMIDFRYSNILTVIFVCFFYSSSMPLLYFSTFLQLTLLFYFDKYWLLRIAKTPRNYDEKLELIVRSVMYYIIFFHCLFAVWVYGTNDIFDAEYLDLASTPASIGGDIIDNLQGRSSGVGEKWFTRLLLKHNIALLCLLALVFAAFLVNGGVFGFLRAGVCNLCKKGGKDATRQKNLTEDDFKKGNSKHSKAKRRKVYFPLLTVLGPDDLSNMIRLCKLSFKSAKDPELKTILRMKLRFLISDYQTKVNSMSQTDIKDLVNFIGLPTYDIRLSPLYKEQFGIDEFLGDENDEWSEEFM